MEWTTKHVSAKSLECPMCMNIFKEPKILPCSHTYCKACLEQLLEYHEEERFIKCPVCRVVNQLPNQDINQLQTNLALQSLLEDVTTECQSCTDCKAKGKNEQATVNCRDCGKYLCLACQEIHDRNFHDHEVLSMNEVSRGGAPSQQRRKCRKHPDEEDQCFCSDCYKYICMKCGVTEHVYKGHHIIDASEQEDIHKKAVEELKSNADTKKAGLQKYINIIDEQEEDTRKVCKQCIDDINQAYDESVRQLAEKRKILVQEVTGRIKKVKTELHSLKATAQKQTNHMTTMTDLVANTNQALLETEAFAAHVTLRQDLGAVLKQENPDTGLPIELGMKGKQIAFNKNMKTSLGSIFEKNAGSAISVGMNAMTSTPDSMMAVGCLHGGIKIFSSEGVLQQTVLSDVKVQGLGFLSDGRLVVRNTDGVLSLFTPQYEKLDVKFDSVNDNHKDGSGGLAVSSDDEICAGNMETKRIEVFSPTGGEATEEIHLPCIGCGPHEIRSYGNAFLIADGGMVRLIDILGREKYKTEDPNNDSCVTATQRKTVLVAWVNHDRGLISIDEFTRKLDYLQTVVTEYKIEKQKRNRYSLQEFTSGEIAFCTPDKLYIFKRDIICACL